MNMVKKNPLEQFLFQNQALRPRLLMHSHNVMDLKMEFHKSMNYI